MKMAYKCRNVSFRGYLSKAKGALRLFPFYFRFYGCSMHRENQPSNQKTEFWQRHRPSPISMERHYHIFWHILPNITRFLICSVESEIVFAGLIRFQYSHLIDFRLYLCWNETGTHTFFIAILSFSKRFIFGMTHKEIANASSTMATII